MSTLDADILSCLYTGCFTSVCFRVDSPYGKVGQTAEPVRLAMRSTNYDDHVVREENTVRSTLSTTCYNITLCSGD